ncbi:MAG: hypothetical protein WC965_05335 [Thiohalomonadaceae bacterium]|jgi:hypothetical protein
MNIGDMMYNDDPCAYAKAILSRCADCSQAQKRNFAEQEAVSCNSPPARQQCLKFLSLLREKALFALQLKHIDGHLPHGKEIKVQCGGLSGLRETLMVGQADEIADIYGLLQAVQENFGEFSALPLHEIIKGISHYQLRKRGKPAD